MTPEEKQRYSEIADTINAILTGRTKKAIEESDETWGALRPSDEEVAAVVEAIDLVDYTDIDKMLNEWTYQAISSHYQTTDLDQAQIHANMPAFGQGGKPDIVFNVIKRYISNNVLDAEEIESHIGWEYKVGYQAEIQHLLNAADGITQANSEDLLDFLIEPGVGAYLTIQQKQGKFFREYGKIVSPDDILGPFVTFSTNPTVQANFFANWPAIETEIRLLESGNANPHYSRGVGKLIVDIVEDSNDQGWIDTLFSDVPLTKSEWALSKDISGDQEKLLGDWAQDPKSIFSGKNKFTPDTILKNQFGDWATDAKKLYLDEFEQNVYQAQNEAREANPNITTAELANITRTEAELAQQNWGTYLGQKMAEFEEGEASEQAEEASKQASENYDELIKSFANEGKAASSIDTWLGSTEIGEEEKKEFAKALSNLYPRSSFEKDQQQREFGQYGISDTRDLIEATVMGLPEGTFSDWVDRGTIERIQGMEIRDALGEAETPKGRAARQRQGYAFSPLGDLKPFSAQRVDRETGMRIQETGSELMKNLHLYPQLVQNQILYGLNRPQGDIVSGLGRETSLPQGLFEGLPPRTTTGITGKEVTLPFEAPPGGAGRFDPSFIQMPDLTKPEYNFGGYNVSTEQPREEPSEVGGLLG